MRYPPRASPLPGLGHPQPAGRRRQPSELEAAWARRKQAALERSEFPAEWMAFLSASAAAGDLVFVAPAGTALHSGRLVEVTPQYVVLDCPMLAGWDWSRVPGGPPGEELSSGVFRIRAEKVVWVWSARHPHGPAGLGLSQARLFDVA